MAVMKFIKKKNGGDEMKASLFRNGIINKLGFWTPFVAPICLKLRIKSLIALLIYTKAPIFVVLNPKPYRS